MVSGNVISIGIYVTYGLSALCGGLILGKGMQHSRLVWGVLYGIIYFLILCVVSIILSKMCIRDRDNNAAVNYIDAGIKPDILAPGVDIKIRKQTAYETDIVSVTAVSYTHLEVYKRQKYGCTI